MANTSATGGYLTPSSPPPLNDDALGDILNEAISGVTGIDSNLVRPKWQPSPPPRPDAATDWCAFGVIEDTTLGGPYIEHDPNANGGAGRDDMTNHKDFVVLVSFYGPHAKGFAEYLADGLKIPQNLEQLQNNFISFVSAGTIRAVPESVNMQWIKRYDLQLYMRRAVTRTYEIQTIETAGIELNVDGHTSIVNVTP